MKSKFKNAIEIILIFSFLRDVEPLENNLNETSGVFEKKFKLQPNLEEIN